MLGSGSTTFSLGSGAGFLTFCTCCGCVGLRRVSLATVAADVLGAELLTPLST